MVRSRAAPRGRSTAGAGSTSTSGRAPRPSMPGLPRCSATSSRSGCSASRGGRDGRRDPDHRRVDAAHLGDAARRQPRGRERLPQLRHAGGLPPRHRPGEDDRRHGPRRRARRAHGGRQRGGRAGAAAPPRAHLRPVPREPRPHHEGGARARALRARARLRGAAHRALHVAEAAHRPRLLPALRQGGRAGGDLPDPGRPHRAAPSLVDRTPALHRRGGARLSRAAHRVRPRRLAVDRGDDRRRLEAPERVDRHLGARAEALPAGLRPLHENLRQGQGLLRHRLPAAPVGARPGRGGRARAPGGGEAALPPRQRRQGVQPEGVTMTEPLLFRVENGVGWIVLNRPEARNAMNAEMRQLYLDALARSAEDAAIRAVVLTGTGKGFCTGADLSGSRAATGAAAPADPGATRDAMRPSQHVIRALWELDKPIVAGVNGVAAGVGAHLAYARDLVVAADDARFIEVFVRRGIALDAGGSFLLPRHVGLHKAKELVFFGDDLSAADAERLGLVNKVVPSAELEAVCRAWGERLAQGPTFALGLSKRLLNRSLQADLDTLFAEEAFTQALVAQSEDMREGIRAFMEKRPPAFKGR